MRGHIHVHATSSWHCNTPLSNLSKWPVMYLLPLTLTEWEGEFTHLLADTVVLLQQASHWPRLLPSFPLAHLPSTHCIRHDCSSHQPASLLRALTHWKPQPHHHELNERVGCSRVGCFWCHQALYWHKCWESLPAIISIHDCVVPCPSHSFEDHISSFCSPPSPPMPQTHQGSPFEAILVLYALRCSYCITVIVLLYWC